MPKINNAAAAKTTFLKTNRKYVAADITVSRQKINGEVVYMMILHGNGKLIADVFPDGRVVPVR